MELSYVFNLTVAQFKNCKAAIKVLTRFGIEYDVAVQIVMAAHDKKMARESREKNERYLLTK